MTSVKFIEKFNKTKEVIESCTTIGHVKTSNLMIDNLINMCQKEELNPEFWKPCVKELRDLLRTKIDVNENYIL